MATTTAGGYKTRILHVEREIKKAKRQLEGLIAKERKSRAVWTKAYKDFLRAAVLVVDIKIHGTKKEASLKAKIKNWNDETDRLTKDRDMYREMIKTTEETLIRLNSELMRMQEQQLSESKTIDEIVTQVFALNETVVRAAQDREQCLNRHIFPRLIDEDNNLRSQLSFTSSDGLKRIVAMVNTMTIVRGDLAADAKKEIQNFFDRFQETTAMADTIKPLYDLTRQLLVEKTDFKVGPDLYRFLAIDLDEEIFPELSRAQTLLKSSIRSEKTNTYIRIYQRENHNSNWVVVPQS